MIAIIFPILTGSVLTGMGTMKLGEANLVSGERWSMPYGFLVFSSSELSVYGTDLHLRLSSTGVEEKVVQAHLELNFDLTDQELLKSTQGDVEMVIGFQLPFKRTEYYEFEFGQRDGQLIIPIEKDVVVVEDEVGVTSLFYVRFNPIAELEWQIYRLLIAFDWEGAIHQESYSVFTIALPVTLGLKPSAVNYPYERLPNVEKAYYADSLGLSVGMELPWDFEVKQSYPSTDTVITEWGGDSLVISLEPDIIVEGKPISGKHLQIIMVEFEVTSLLERRDRLLFDSGLYMGLGIGLLFSGIHESLKAFGEMRKRSDNDFP